VLCAACRAVSERAYAALRGAGVWCVHVRMLLHGLT
jgi:hypothetical protein